MKKIFLYTVFIGLFMSIALDLYVGLYLSTSSRLSLFMGIGMVVLLGTAALTALILWIDRDVTTTAMTGELAGND